MKAIALKLFVGLFGAFAAYYSYFLGSVFYELYGPSARFCGTAQVWALQGGRGFLCATSVARFCRALVRWQAKGDGRYWLFESQQSGACHFDIVRTGQSGDFYSDVMMPNDALQQTRAGQVAEPGSLGRIVWVSNISISVQ